MEHRSNRSHFVENKLRKSLWSFSKIEHLMIREQENKTLIFIMNYKFFTLYVYSVDRDSSVGTATRYWLGGPGIASR